MDLRLQAMRTMGLMGMVGEEVYYTHHRREGGGALDGFSGQVDQIEEDSEEV